MRTRTYSQMYVHKLNREEKEEEKEKEEGIKTFLISGATSTKGVKGLGLSQNCVLHPTVITGLKTRVPEERKNNVKYKEER
jgi:hypothetical protein